MQNETTVWQFWDCIDCGKKGVSCKYQECPECGHRRTFEEFDNRYLPGEENFDDPANKLSLVEEEKLERAGISWFCTNCQSDNYGDTETCHYCDAKKGATDEDLRKDVSYKGFETYMEEDQGKTADLVENFGPYAGMRAAVGESFQLEDEDHESQLKRSVQERNPFGRNKSKSRPEWEKHDLPSSVESKEKFFREKNKERKKIFKDMNSWGPGSEDAPPESSDLNPFAFIGVLVSIVIIVITSFYVYNWVTSTHPVAGKITGSSWTHTIQVQKWTDVTKNNWRHRISERSERPPSNGRGEVAGVQVTSCRQRHYDDERYQCGTEEVPCTHRVAKTETYSCSKTETYNCGTYQCNCTYRDNGNGSATRSCSTCTRTCTRSVPSTCTKTVYETPHITDTVPKYCTRPIYRSYCNYKTQEWKNAYSKVDSGRGSKDLSWPDVDISNEDRKILHSKYQINISYSENKMPKNYILTPSSKGEYLYWHKEKEVVLLINNLGGVSQVIPKSKYQQRKK